MKPIWLPFGLKPKEALQDDGPRYADLYERGMAAAIDITLLFVVFGSLFDYVTVRFYRMADRDALNEARYAASMAEALQYFLASGLPQLWLLNALLQLLVIGLFLVGAQWVWRTTPGKYAMGISVRRNGTLEQPERWRYVLRFLGYIPSAPLFFWLSFNKKHRAIHDLIAGTVVIHLRPRGWYWAQVKRGYRWVRGRISGTAVE